MGRAGLDSRAVILSVGWIWVATDFDGDGRADFAMVANGAWTLWLSLDDYAKQDPFRLVP